MIDWYSYNPNKRYSITLSDGTIISNLILNGNNFISKEVITEDIFKNNLTNVIISDGENSETHEYMQLIQIAQYEENGDYYICLTDIPKDELRLMTMESQIEYLSMMTGYDI